MKTHLFSTVGIAISLGFLCSMSWVTAATKPIKAPVVTSTINATSFEQYYQECLQRVKKQGLAADVAKDVCNCTIAKFKSQYNIQQFTTIVQKSKTDKTSARQLANVGETCFEQVLYEQ